MPNRLVALGLGACLALGFALAGCSITVVTPTDQAAGSGDLSSDGTDAEDTPGPSPIVIDPALLAILPRQVDSLPLTETDDADTNALADDVLPTIATAAVGVEAGDSKTGDVVTGFVIRLKPEAFNDGVFRDWRDSYDSGLCGGQDQVVGNAEQKIGDNTVYIGTCTNGLHTYHVWIQDKGLLISLTSFGQKQLAVVLLENLRKATPS
jgi:hypothetical protein